MSVMGITPPAEAPTIFIPMRRGEAVIRAVCQLLPVHREDLIGPARHLPLVHARRVACRVMRVTFEMTYAAIGRETGRDHPTVLHAVKRAEWLAETDPTFAAHVDAVAARATEIRLADVHPTQGAAS